MSKKNHISRLAAPKTWPIKRKGIKWIAKPIPGTHNQEYAIPLVAICRDMLELTSTVKETKQILNKGNLLINNRIIKKHKFPAGIFDVISLPATNEHYRVVMDPLGKLAVISIPEKEASLIPLKVVGKRSIKTNKTQINLNNGWNILNDKEKVSPGDVILYDFKTNKISKVIHQKKGNSAFIIGGKHTGNVVELKDIIEKGKLRKTKIAVLRKGKETWETPLKYTFMIGGKSPEVKVTDGGK